MTPMVPGNTYTDFQGTIYTPAANPTPGDGQGALSVAVQSTQRHTNKLWLFPCDAARLSTDKMFQAKLVGTNLWYQTAWAPMAHRFSKFVPA